MNYTDKCYCLIPEVEDIGNHESYGHFLRVLVRKDIYVYHVRDIIISYLKTESYNEYNISDFIKKMIIFLTDEIENFDKNKNIYREIDLNKYKELLVSYQNFNL